MKWDTSKSVWASFHYLWLLITLFVIWNYFCCDHSVDVHPLPSLRFAVAVSRAATAPAIGMGGWWAGVTRSGWQLSNPAIYLHVRIHASTPSVIGLNLIPFSQTIITQSHWSEALWSLCFMVEPPRPTRQSHGRIMAKLKKSISVRDKC